MQPPALKTGLSLKVPAREGARLREITRGCAGVQATSRSSSSRPSSTSSTTCRETRCRRDQPRSAEISRAQPSSAETSRAQPSSAEMRGLSPVVAPALRLQPLAAPRHRCRRTLRPSCTTATGGTPPKGESRHRDTPPARREDGAVAILCLGTARTLHEWRKKRNTSGLDFFF